jgi:hypothetical protein
MELNRKRSRPHNVIKHCCPSTLVCTAVPNGIQQLRTLFGSDDFAFIVNGTRIANNVFEAVVLSPTVADRLLSDGSLREFLVGDAIIDPLSPVRFRELISRVELKLSGAAFDQSWLFATAWAIAIWKIFSFAPDAAN